MQKYRFMILLALVAIIATGCAPLFTTPPATTSEAPPSNTIDATFVCPDGTSLDTTFDNTAHTVTVALPDGTVTLPQVESADGGKYSDGTTTFWNKGDEALVEVSGNIVYQNCTTQPAGDTSNAPASDTIEATFVCPDGTSLDTVFDNSAHTVTVTMPQGTVTLPQVESADGANYCSGTIIFWKKGDEATVEVDGKPVYQNCTTQPAGDSSEAPATDTIEATFVCPDGTSLNTVFDNSAHTVTVTMPQGTVTLPQVESADGARYSSGTITFWNKGDEATVEVDGKPVYQNCTTQPADGTSAAPADTTADDNIIDATFVCPDGTSLDTVFNNNDHTATVALPDGTVTLPQTISADGARYSDGTTTIWNKGNTLMVQVNDETILQDCVAQPAS